MITKEVGHIRFEKIYILIHGPTTNVMWTADVTYERDKFELIQA